VETDDKENLLCGEGERCVEPPGTRGGGNDDAASLPSLPATPRSAAAQSAELRRVARLHTVEAHGHGRRLAR
jgi:hypothetical protein